MQHTLFNINIMEMIGSDFLYVKLSLAQKIQRRQLFFTTFLEEPMFQI
jgi:hypothetical protein